MGYVESIRIAEDAGEPMQFAVAAMAIAHFGLAGDRYAGGRGVYSDSVRPKVRQVSLIEAEAIEEARRQTGVEYQEQDTRRNIITRGVNLQNLIGKVFLVGEVAMYGTEECVPCARPGNLSGKRGFGKDFKGLGGLRARVLNDGLIAVHNEIYVPTNLPLAV